MMGRRRYRRDVRHGSGLPPAATTLLTLLVLMSIQPGVANATYSRTGAFGWGAYVPSDANTTFGSTSVRRDYATGLPRVVYDDGVAHWNPLTVALYGLQEFNRYVGFARQSNLRRAE